MNTKTEEVETTPTTPPIERTFIYVQLEKLAKLPKTKDKLEIHLSHAKNTLRKLQDHYTTNTVIDLDEMREHGPTTFALIIVSACN